MFYLLLSFISVFLIPSTLTKNLPSYITACKLEDPNFKECAIESANLAIPHIIKGDSNYNIESLLPRKAPLIEVKGNQVILKCTNCELSGFENAILKNIEVDPILKKIKIVLNIKSVTISGNYEVESKLKGTTLKGSGPGNVIIVNGEYKYDFNYELNEIDGTSFIKITKDEADSRMDKILFNFEKISQGSKISSELNQNWETVAIDQNDSFNALLVKISRSVVGRYFERIPFNLLFK